MRSVHSRGLPASHGQLQRGGASWSGCLTIGTPAIAAARAPGPGHFKPPTSRATTPLSCSTLPCSTPWRRVQRDLPHGDLVLCAPWPEEVPAAEDGCGVVSYTTTVDSVWVDSLWTLNLTHVATDECLNSASLVETLTVIDTTPRSSRLSPRTSSGLHRQPSPTPCRGGRCLRHGHLDEHGAVE